MSASVVWGWKIRRRSAPAPRPEQSLATGAGSATRAINFLQQREPAHGISRRVSETAVQIVARGPRADAEAAAAAIDADPALEGATYSILEEDEARALWRIDAYPTSDAEADALRRVLAGFAALDVRSEPLADADWLKLALSGLPPVQGRALLRLWRARRGPGAGERGRAPDRGRRGVRHRPPRHDGGLPRGPRPAAQGAPVRPRAGRRDRDRPARHRRGADREPHRARDRHRPGLRADRARERAAQPRPRCFVDRQRPRPPDRSRRARPTTSSSPTSWPAR